MPNTPALLPFLEIEFKNRSIDAVSELAAARGALFEFALPFGGVAWLATSYALSSNLLSDPRFSKILPLRDPKSQRPHRLYRHLLVTDPPEHTRLRRQLQAALAPWTSARIEALARDVVSRHVKAIDVKERRFDLVARIAMPTALEITCTMVGIPQSAFEKVRDWNDKLTRSDLEGEDRANEIAEDIEAHLLTLVRDDAILAGDGAIAGLARAMSAGDLNEGEAMALAFLLISAGYETTGHLLSSAVRMLVSDREIWRSIALDDNAARRAVEECLRLNPSLELSTPRCAREDVEIENSRIRSGDLLFVALGAANRDPSVFASGSKLECERSGGARHLSFGRGPHTCPGAGIARVTARIFLQELAYRFPGLSLPADHAPEWIPGLVMRGIRSLPVLVDGDQEMHPAKGGGQAQTP